MLHCLITITQDGSSRDLDVVVDTRVFGDADRADCVVNHTKLLDEGFKLAVALDGPASRVTISHKSDMLPAFARTTPFSPVTHGLGRQLNDLIASLVLEAYPERVDAFLAKARPILHPDAHAPARLTAFAPELDGPDCPSCGDKGDAYGLCVGCGGHVEGSAQLWDVDSQ